MDAVRLDRASDDALDVRTVPDPTPVGGDVDGFRPGDVVVERPLRSCGTRAHCRNGRQQVCPSVRITGFHHDGAFAARTVVPAAPSTASRRRSSGRAA